MTKAEFLSRLRSALGNDLSGSVVQENVSYYDGYISDEVRKGRSEEEVTAELGDPWAIARTIIDSVESQGGGYEEYTYEPRQKNYEREQEGRTGNVHVFGLDSWWKKLVLILGILGVFLIIIAVIGGIFSLLAPLIVPLCIIWLILRLLGSRR